MPISTLAPIHEHHLPKSSKISHTFFPNVSKIISNFCGFFQLSPVFPNGFQAFSHPSAPVPRPGASVFDLGFGSGVMTAMLLAQQPQALVTGVDMEDKVKLATETLGGRGLGDVGRMQKIHQKTIAW